MSGVDVGQSLSRALERSADLAGIALTVTSGEWTCWASATFIGARHELALAVPAGPAAAAWLAALPEVELAVRGHLVADLKIVGVRADAGRLTAMLEALTVEER